MKMKLSVLLRQYQMLRQNLMAQIAFALLLTGGYLAAIHRHLWPERTPSLKDLSVPGPEAHRPLGWDLPGALLPHRQVQAVDGDMLRDLRAEQVQKIHLDPADSKLNLWSRHSRGWGHGGCLQLSEVPLGWGAGVGVGKGPGKL